MDFECDLTDWVWLGPINNRKCNLKYSWGDHHLPNSGLKNMKGVAIWYSVKVYN